MYKSRFKRWGLWKNTKAADVAEVLRQATTTAVETGTVAVASAPDQVYYVNGKQVDAQRVERYIRNRCRQHRLRPGELSASLLDRAAAASARSRAIIAEELLGPSPLGLRATRSGGGAGALLLAEEATYRVVQDYFDGSLASGRWVFASPGACDLATPPGAETGRLTGQIHERFKTAAEMLAQPGTPEAVEGLKIARICFAELQRVLDSSLGPEDPIFLVVCLTALQHIADQGDTLHWLAVQLVRYMADLAQTLPGARPGRGVWAALRDLVVARSLTKHVSLQIVNVAREACLRYLGPTHAKTVEVTICGYSSFDTDVDAQIALYTAILDELDALGEFDERHVGVRMNLATYYNVNKMAEKAVQVSLDVVDNPWMLEQSKRYRGIAYKFLYEVGVGRQRQRRLEEAVRYFREAIDVVRWEMAEGHGRANQANLLEGSRNLEQCLRDLGRHDEADNAAAERDRFIRDGLEGVGEKDKVEIGEEHAAPDQVDDDD